MKFAFEDWKPLEDSIGGAIAALCCVFGVLGFFRLSPFSLVDGFVLIPGIWLVFHHVIVIKKEESK